MAAKPFTVEGLPTFPRKLDANAFFKAMLANYRDGQRVSLADEVHLRALLKHHTEYANKFGSGIDHFVVDKNTQYRPVTRCFWIIRTDGSRDDMSYLHCITPKKT